VPSKTPGIPQLIQAKGEWRATPTVMEHNMTKLERTSQLLRSICGNGANGVDGCAIFKYHPKTRTKSLQLIYKTPVDFTLPSRRPAVDEPNYPELEKRIHDFCDDLIDPVNMGQAMVVPFHHMTVALLALDGANSTDGLVEVFAYFNYLGDDKDKTEANAERLNPEVSNMYRADMGLDQR
jgi:hypothetical protein